MIILESIQPSCNVSERWIEDIYINNSPAMWNLKDVVTKADDFYELASRCPGFGTVCSDLSDICLCYWISGHGQRGGKTADDI